MFVRANAATSTLPFIVLVERMALSTGFPLRVLIGYTIRTSVDVLPPSDQFKVGRSNTTRLTARMVQFPTSRKMTRHAQERNMMGQPCTVPYAESAVAQRVNRPIP